MLAEFGEGVVVEEEAGSHGVVLDFVGGEAVDVVDVGEDGIEGVGFGFGWCVHVNVHGGSPRALVGVVGA